MMLQQNLKYLSILIGSLFIVGCRQAKYVGEGNYLHKKNEINFVTISPEGDTVKSDEQEGIYSSEMYDLLKPLPNKKFKLFIYNRIDTARYADQLDRKKNKTQKKNDHRKQKEKKINDRRINKARKKGKEFYRQKEIELKEQKNGWRDWVLVHMGQKPVLYDSSLVAKSNKQLEIYVHKRGYFDATVSDTVIFKEKKRKAFVEYTVYLGEPYRIDTFYIDPMADANVIGEYRKFCKADKSVIETGALIDEDVLDLERENFSRYGRDQGAFFGFNKSYITFEVDTLSGGHSARVVMHVAPKLVEHPYYPDSLVPIEYGAYTVRNVTFYLHNPDTLSFKYGFEFFKKRCDQYNLPYIMDNQYVLLDTLVNIDTIYFRNGDTKITHKGVFIYNDVPFLEPDLIDKNNFLYIPHFAKEEYLERSYRALLQLDVFSTITPIVEVDPSDPLGRGVNVTYHLTPAKRQTFVLEPKVVNSNSIVGIMGQVSYNHKNLFRGAQKLKVSFVGGFEAQPLIVSRDGVEEKSFSLNTFQWGPSIQLTFPKLVPMTKKFYQNSSKRAFPTTKFDLTVNFEKRTEFKRRLAHFSFEWNFKVSGDEGKKDEYAIKWINFDFVRLEKTDEFKLKLAELNDPFLLNSYADHFTLYNGISYKKDSQKPNQENKFIRINTFNAIQSGGLLGVSSIGSNSLSDDGLKQIFGVPFTQFIRIDNQYLLLWKINKKHKLAARFLAGIGFAYGNSPSLPYEQSFYSGGSNDIRAFPARSMAPGSIRTFEDTTRTTTQIGDMRLQINLEYRFYITDMLEGALFVDMGNIWKIKDDTTTMDDDLGIFKFNTFWKQVAIGPGIGIRADFDFLIVRLDIAFALHNPYLPAGEKWFGTPYDTYYSNWDFDGSGKIEAGDTDGSDPDDPTLVKPGDESYYPYFAPHALRFNIGIGYPF